MNIKYSVLKIILNVPQCPYIGREGDNQMRRGQTKGGGNEREGKYRLTESFSFLRLLLSIDQLNLKK